MAINEAVASKATSAEPGLIKLSSVLEVFWSNVTSTKLKIWARIAGHLVIM